MAKTPSACLLQALEQMDWVRSRVGNQVAPTCKKHMPSSTVSLLKRTYCEWSNHNSMRLAAAMAFYTMMSLAPLLVIALTILSFIYSGDVAQQNIKDRATLMLGSQGGDAVGQMLAAMTKHASHGIVATIVSFVVALVSGSSLFVNMQDAMNTIWDVKPRSNVSW